MYCYVLLLKIIFKAITIPLKDSNVLVILRILNVILPSFYLRNRSIINFKHKLLVDTAGHETSLLSQRTYMFDEYYCMFEHHGQAMNNCFMK